MQDLLPGTIHRESIGDILRRLIFSYKATDTTEEKYDLDIRLTFFSSSCEFVIPHDNEKLEQKLQCLDEDFVLLSFPKLDSRPYVLRKVELAGEYFSCIERID